MRRSSRDLRTLIVEAAERTFGDLGYTDATMTAIAEHAGVTRSVLTRHFPTKAELFSAVVSVPFVRFVEKWVETWKSQVGVPRSEPVLVEEFVSQLYRNARLSMSGLRLLMFQSYQLDDDVRSRVWTTLNDGITSVMEIAEQEFRARGYATRNIDITIRAIIGMVVGYALLDPALANMKTTESDVVVPHLSSLILHGLVLDGLEDVRDSVRG